MMSIQGESEKGSDTEGNDIGNINLHSISTKDKKEQEITDGVITSQIEIDHVGIRGYLNMRQGNATYHRMKRYYCRMIGILLYRFHAEELASDLSLATREIEIAKLEEWDGKGRLHMYTNTFKIITTTGSSFHIVAVSAQDKTIWTNHIKNAILASTEAMKDLSIKHRLSNLEMYLSPGGVTLKKNENEPFNTIAQIPLFENTGTCSHRNCTIRFDSASKRQHHCRNCGKTICSTHGNIFVPLLHLGITNSVRICMRCFRVERFLQVLRSFVQFYIYSRYKNNNINKNTINYLMTNLTDKDKVEIELVSEILKDNDFGVSDLLQSLHLHKKGCNQVFYLLTEKLISLLDSNLDDFEFFLPQLFHIWATMDVFMSNNSTNYNSNYFLKYIMLYHVLMISVKKHIRLAIKIYCHIRGAVDDSCGLGFNQTELFIPAHLYRKFSFYKLFMINLEMIIFKNEWKFYADDDLVASATQVKMIQSLFDRLIILQDIDYNNNKNNMSKIENLGCICIALVTNALPKYFNYNVTNKVSIPRDVDNVTASPIESPSKSPSKIHQEIIHSTKEKNDDLNMSSLSVIFNDQLLFMRSLCEIAESLRHIQPPKERKQHLPSYLAKLMKILPPFVFYPLETCVDKIQQVINILINEGTVFSTKARAPTMIYFETKSFISASNELSSLKHDTNHFKSVVYNDKYWWLRQFTNTNVNSGGTGTHRRSIEASEVETKESDPNTVQSNSNYDEILLDHEEISYLLKDTLGHVTQIDGENVLNIAFSQQEIHSTEVSHISSTNSHPDSFTNDTTSNISVNRTMLRKTSIRKNPSKSRCLSVAASTYECVNSIIEATDVSNNNITVNNNNNKDSNNHTVEEENKIKDFLQQLSPEQLSEITKNMKETISDQMNNTNTNTNATIKGKTIVDWLVNNTVAPTRVLAVGVGNEMIKQNFLKEAQNSKSFNDNDDIYNVLVPSPTPSPRKLHTNEYKINTTNLNTLQPSLRSPSSTTNTSDSNSHSHSLLNTQHRISARRLISPNKYNTTSGNNSTNSNNSNNNSNYSNSYQSPTSISGICSDDDLEISNSTNNIKTTIFDTFFPDKTLKLMDKIDNYVIKKLKEETDMNHEDKDIELNLNDLKSQINIICAYILEKNEKKNIAMLSAFGESFEEKIRRIKEKSIHYTNIINNNIIDITSNTNHNDTNSNNNNTTNTSIHTNNNDHWNCVGMIVKSNDDLRQEVFCLQLLMQFQDIFNNANLPLRLFPYKIIAISASTGFIEVIQNALSLDSLKKKRNYVSLLSHFKKTYGGEGSISYQNALTNYVRSMAAYSLACYFLMIKDRHNGNIMLDNKGNIVHIDFGFVLGIAPGGRFSLETAPFKLTSEMVEAMGGTDSEYFKEYVILLIQGFIALQQNADTILMMIAIMAQDSSFPCFVNKNPRDILSKIKNLFKLELDQRGVVQYVLKLISQSHNSYGNRQYDRFQKVTNGIVA